MMAYGPEVLLVDVSGLGKLLGLSEQAIRARWKRGLIPRSCAVRLGRALRFDIARVRDWIDAQRVVSEEESARGV